MSQPIYEVAPRAREELYRAALRARDALQHGLIENGLWRRISEDDARKMYWADVRKIMRDAHIEVNPNSPIAVQCQNCRKVEMVARDVKSFKCHCSSYEEQWVCKSRYIDAFNGTRVLSMTD